MNEKVIVYKKLKSSPTVNNPRSCYTSQRCKPKAHNHLTYFSLPNNIIMLRTLFSMVIDLGPSYRALQLSCNMCVHSFSIACVDQFSEYRKAYFDTKYTLRNSNYLMYSMITFQGTKKLVNTVFWWHIKISSENFSNVVVVLRLPAAPLWVTCTLNPNG